MLRLLRVIDAGITVTNRDDPQEGDIVSAVVEITSNASTGDELLFVNQTKVVLDTSKTNTATKLHLKAVDGTTTTADFQAALRLVEFNNTSTPSEATRTVTFTVTDAATTTGETPKTHTATRDVTVQATKDSPVVDMASPSAGMSHMHRADSNTIAATDKTATFVEVQEQIQLPMRRHLGRLFQT